MRKEETDNNFKSDIQDTKKKIMEATIQLLWKNGYKGTTTKQIAELAGVNEVTIFRNFHNKENLIDETFSRAEDMADPLREFFENEFPTVKVFLDKFSDLLYKHWDRNKEMHLSCLREIGNKKTEYVKRDVNAVKYIMTLFTEKLTEMHKQGKIKKTYIKDLTNIYHSATLAVFIWHSVNDNETTDKNIKQFLKGLSKILSQGIE